jgi:hypothetical protein
MRMQEHVMLEVRDAKRDYLANARRCRSVERKDWTADVSQGHRAGNILNDPKHPVVMTEQNLVPNRPIVDRAGG